jgi:hypothetical protein
LQSPSNKTILSIFTPFLLSISLLFFAKIAFHKKTGAPGGMPAAPVCFVNGMSA